MRARGAPGSRHPLSRDRPACGRGRGGRGARRRHPARKAVRGLARRRRPDSRGGQKVGRPARRQLAFALVSAPRDDQAADRRGRHRRRDRGSLLRRQPRSALSSRRQGRGVGRGGAAREADVVVVQQGRGRRQPARLSRLWRDARDLVHERRGADRGDRGRRSAARGSKSTSIRSPFAATPVASRNSRRAGATFTDPWTRSRSPSAASSSSVRKARSRATTTRRMSACRPAPSRSSAIFRSTN